MAKKVIMIAPFDVLSGNVSGKQKLKYANNDNSAYEAPVGKVNYARNYKPRYITAMRSSDGRAFFSVRTKNGVNLSSRAKHSMAVYGGTFALIGSLMAQDEASINSFVTYYAYAVQKGQFEGTFRQYLTAKISQALKNYQSQVVFSDPDLPGTKIISNPWVATSITGDITVTKEVLKKFWDELAIDPISNKIDGLTFVAHRGNTFNDIIASHYNVLGLTKVSVSGTDYVKLGDMFVQSIDETETPVNPTFVQANEAVYNTGEDVRYISTSESPE